MMSERMIPVPESLIERAVQELFDAPGREALLVCGELHARLSQPTPTAETFPPESGDDRYRRVTGEEPPVHIDSVTDPGNYWHDAEPPRPEDMAPGTAFTVQQWGGQTRFHVTAGTDGRHPVHPEDGGGWFAAEDLDPSTIRDVAPPKEKNL